MSDINNDLTPASAPTAGALAFGAPPASDSFGMRTATAASPIVWGIPPVIGRYARADGFTYHNLAAATQTVTVMVTLQSLPLVTVALAGQAVIQVANGSVLNPVDNSVIAANDWIMVRNSIEQWQAYRIASISGGAITIDVSIGDADGSGFVKPIPLDPGGSTVFYMGAPGDHSKRQYLVPTASNHPGLLTYFPPNGIGTAPVSGQPILVHSANATTAGYMGVSYSSIVL